MTLTTPREVHLQVSSPTTQRVTLPCDNTIIPHSATNTLRPYIKHCIRHVNCIDHVACLLMARSCPSQDIAIQHTIDSPTLLSVIPLASTTAHILKLYTQAVILACLPSLGDICIPNVPHNPLCIAWGHNLCVPASEYLPSIMDKAQPKPSPSSIVKCLASRWHSECHTLTSLFITMRNTNGPVCSYCPREFLSLEDTDYPSTILCPPLGLPQMAQGCSLSATRV
ncbi:unnamed protein product [Prunus armeniaca]